MPYTRTTWQDYPNTTTPITATALNNIESQLVTLDRQIGTYANEAARDAAIGSPTEGMIAYLTAPTVPAATGATTAVPTGVTTVYNGSVWVCTSPVGAHTTASGAVTSTSYTATLTGSPGTNPTVTLVTGTTALVSIGAFLNNSGAGTSIMSVAVSGAGTVAASDAWGLSVTGSSYFGNGLTFVITGLTAGTNTFALNYRVGSNTGNYEQRRITVQGVA